MQPKVQYKQPPLLFRNLGKGKFENVGAPLGAGRSTVRSSAAARPTATSTTTATSTS